MGVGEVPVHFMFLLPLPSEVPGQQVLDLKGTPVSSGCLLLKAGVGHKLNVKPTPGLVR